MRSALALALLGLAGVGCGGTQAVAPADLAQPSPDGGGAQDLANADGAGGVFFHVTDDESGHDLPARVLITAVPGTPPVRFDINAKGEKTNGDTATSPAAGVVGSPEGVMLVSGAALLPLAAGSYDVFISHGPEWEAEVRKVTVRPRDTTVVEAPLRHTVDTRGWMSADLHIHTGRSYDSRLQVDARVVSEVTVGVQLLVSTDHNVFTDLQPDLDQLGYASRAHAIVGDEFNFVEGHGGVYPVTYDGAAQDPTGFLDGGAAAARLDWDHARLVHSAEMFDALHALPTHPAVTVNHPRLLPDLGYFINWDGARGWSPPAPPPDAGRFDAMEILSGYMQTPADLALVLRDWFFYLNTGTRLTGLGSSDTHRLRDVHAGFPRTFLRVASDQPSQVTGSDLAEAIRRGRATASNGPWALLTVDGAGVGDLVTNQTGAVMVDATVDAPGWIDVDKLRVFVNGRVVEERDLPHDGRRPIFHDRFPVTLPAGDAWVLLQVGGSRPLPDGLIGARAPGMVMPFAITSPVYVDGDGDGGFKPAFATLKDADPGPISPLTLGLRGVDQDPYSLDLPPPPFREAPQDCEPPLWTNPHTFQLDR